MKISRLDHLVLTVKDLDKTCDFYNNVLGMETQTFSGNRRALTFGAQKINLHQYCNELEPKALAPTPGAADLCFISDVPIDDMVRHLKDCRVVIIEGPVKKIKLSFRLFKQAKNLGGYFFYFYILPCIVVICAKVQCGWGHQFDILQLFRFIKSLFSIR